MARLEKIIIDNYRSLGHVELRFVDRSPLILVGENNAGKSNIIKAIDLLLGEFWPGSHEPEDHEFFNRDPNQPIKIEAVFSEPLGSFTSLFWEYNPENGQDELLFRGVTEEGALRYVSQEVRSNLICVTITADRRLQYQLSYSSKYTWLSKLMRKFHQALKSDLEICSELEGEFQGIKETFKKVEEFKTFRDSLRDDFSDSVQTMTYKLDVDFEAYNPTNFFHALRLQANEGGTVRTIEELGTGEEQILAMSFAHAYAKAFHGGILLAIEEPEAHLHPQAQDWLARKIRKMAGDGLQIVLETHSPSFINLLNLEGLCLVRKEPSSGSRTIQLSLQEFTRYCIQKGAAAERTSDENILPFYDASSTKEILEGFFAKKVVIVEGPTESLALPIYLLKLGLDTEKEGISIIPVHGKGNISKWIRFFGAYQIPTYVIFDNDPEDDTSGNKRKDILKTLGIEDATAVQTIISERNLNVADKFAVFGSDFESCMRIIFAELNYNELEREARDFLESDSKPMIARYVADKTCQDSDVESNVWIALKNLTEKIKSC